MLFKLLAAKEPLEKFAEAVAQGADINAVDKTGHSVLDIAIDDMCVDVAAWLVEKGARLANSPLYYAAKKGNLEMVQHCLEKGNFDINKRYHDGFTALIVATSEAHEHFKFGEQDHYNQFAKIVRLLMEHGANANLANDTQQTALHAAAHFGEYEIAKIILEISAEQKKRINLNAEDVYGLTPLHFACRAGNLKVAELLLQWGADPNVQEKYGFTPLHEAVENNHIEILRLLLKNGADRTLSTSVDFKPYYVGTSPLDIAKMRNFRELVILLEA